jgi:hypothetical protein
VPGPRGGLVFVRSSVRTPLSGTKEAR